MTPPGRAMSTVAPVFSAALPARKIMDFRAGETIISQGEECTDVHYIDEGIVKLTSVSNRGRGDGRQFHYPFIDVMYVRAFLALRDNRLSRSKVHNFPCWQCGRKYRRHT